MLSSVSKLADKPFVLGFLIPSVLALFSVYRIYGCPAWLGNACNIKSDNPFANLTYAALVVWIVAVLLVSVNHWFIRWLEGYEGPFAWFACFKALQRARYRRRRRAYVKAKGNGRLRGRLRADWLTWFPWTFRRVLPTGFGNAIRAFEVYPLDVYGFEAITGYDRLGSVVSRDFEAAISDAKSQVDFFVNITMMSALIAVGSLFYLIVEYLSGGQKVPLDWARCFWSFVVYLAVSVSAYWVATLSVPHWGNLVKAAFDCYLPELAIKMGYQLPATTAERRRFWGSVSELITFRYLPIPPNELPYLPSTSEAKSQKEKASEVPDGKADDAELEETDKKKENQQYCEVPPCCTAISAVPKNEPRNNLKE